MKNLSTLVPPSLPTTPSTTLSQPPTPIVMKADSGASGMYIREDDKHVLHDLQPFQGPSAILPDASTIHATKKSHLPIPGLSPTATKAYVFDKLHSSSLLSVGTLCDDGCHVVFDKHHMRVYKNHKEILTGERNFSDKLWDVNISSSQPHHANVIIRQDQTTKELIQYFQGCCFSPTKSTFF